MAIYSLISDSHRESVVSTSKSQPGHNTMLKAEPNKNPIMPNHLPGKALGFSGPACRV